MFTKGLIYRWIITLEFQPVAMTACQEHTRYCFLSKKNKNKQKGILVQNKQLNIAVTRLTKPCVRTIERKWCHQKMIGCLTLPNGSWAHLHPFRAPHGSTLTYRMTTLTVSAKPSGEEQRRPRRSLAEVEVHLREWGIKTAPLNGKIEFKVCKPLGVHWS